jgi:hypothetical protein
MTRPCGHDPAYCVAPGIRWIVEERGVRIIDELARRSEALGYPEAAVWELLLRGHSLPETVRMVRHIAGVTGAQAQMSVERCIDRWCKAGWLTGRENALQIVL